MMTQALLPDSITICLDQIGKQFNHQCLFRGLSESFKTGQSYAILGNNGSGKSTLLQMLAAYQSPSEGKIQFQANGKLVAISDWFRKIAFTSPFLTLLEDYALKELLAFHFRLKPYLTGWDAGRVLALLGLINKQDLALKYFSAGMKQRVKLALAFCSNAPVLLLDEPTVSLDQQGITWYLQLISELTKGRLLVIASNQSHEYDCCTHRIHLAAYQ